MQCPARRPVPAPHRSSRWRQLLSFCLGVALAWGLLACGDGGSDTPGDGGIVDPGDGAVPEAGQVSLRNDTPWAIEAAYLHVDPDPDPDADERIVRVQVAAGGQTAISDGELPAETEVEFDFVLLVPESEGLRVRRKATVTVDGDITLVASLPEAGEPFSLTVEPEPAEDA